MAVQDSKPERVGLIGLGNAGRAMLGSLSQRFSVTVFDRDESRCNEAAARGPQVTAAQSASAVGEACEAVILSLPQPEASQSVCKALAPAVAPGTLIIETSTVGPDHIEALHQILSPGGASIIDAAIVGGIERLAAGEATFLVGANAADAGAVSAVLETMAEDIRWLGTRGAGMRMKLVVNAVSHATYVVLAEAGAIAAAQGLPLDTLRDLLGRDTGLLRPLTHRFGERLEARDFSGGMSTANARKDSRLVLELADTLGVPLFALPVAHEAYEKAGEAGLDGQDYAALATLWEEWLGIDLSSPGRTPD